MKSTAKRTKRIEDETEDIRLSQINMESVKADKSERARLSSLRVLNEKEREIRELSQRLEMISNMLEKLNTEKNLMIKYQLGFLEQFQRENNQ